MYDLRVVVEEVGGFCDLPAKPGDYFELKGSRLYIPPGQYICIWALQTLMPLLPAKQRDSTDPNDWLQNTSRVCCPDPNGRVIYRIERILPGEGGAVLAKEARESAPVGEGEAASAGEPATPAGSIGHMIVDESVCSGCRSCELICSFWHEKVFDPNLSRVQVGKDEPSGRDTPVVCRQCGVARCVQVCPQGALSRHPLTKAVLVDASLCTGCGLCVEACPFSAVRMHPEAGVPLLCDLCDGDPQCVRRCVTGALWYGEARQRPKRHTIGPQEPGSPRKELSHV